MWVCRLPVHIDPAGYTVFTGIFGEFVTAQWADRVVGPYDSQTIKNPRKTEGFLCWNTGCG